MYEFDVGHERILSNSVPQAVIDDFSTSRPLIDSLTVIPWEEHCTECAMPQCYATCDLYEPRKDGKCRRFVGGISPIHGIPNSLGYVARIQFKPWGQLIAHSNLHLVQAAKAERIYRISLKLDNVISHVPDYHINILGRRGISSRLMRRVKKYITTNGIFADTPKRTPDCLLLEIYNPNDSIVRLTLVGRDSSGPLKGYPFQKLIELKPGFTREIIPFLDIEPHISSDNVFHISICPNINDLSAEGPTLYFGMLTFVKWNIELSKEQILPEKKLKHVKVLIWDLDNTLWNGILIEDGASKLKLRDGVVDILKELDRRGIVNSIASKNNHDDAKTVLQELQLLDYFVFPKFNWAPKSESIKEIIENINVGEDTIAFIDDSPFERSEVSKSFSKVRVFDAIELDNLLSMPDFSPEISDESHLRRSFYKIDEKRQQIKSSYSGDYSKFLCECRIKLTISPVSENNLDRVTELIQRTNQLNFSGNRYTQEQIITLLANEGFEAFCIHCEDRFGDYGMIGFCMFNQELSRIVDLMFSCRVQSKQVEHAFFRSFLAIQKSKGADKVEVVYRSTAKNAQLTQVFRDIGFHGEIPGSDPSEQLFSIALNNDISPESIIEVNWCGI